MKGLILAAAAAMMLVRPGFADDAACRSLVNVDLAGVLDCLIAFRRVADICS